METEYHEVVFQLVEIVRMLKCIGGAICVIGALYILDLLSNLGKR